MKKKLNCILLIDDDEPTNFIHERVIKKLDCAEKVISLLSAEDALKYLQIKNGDNYPCPDLIFLDINMPGMDGWEFLEEYQKLGSHQRGRIVVVMLTTSVNPDDEEKAHQLSGISGFRIKPLTREVLQEILEEHFADYL